MCYREQEVAGSNPGSYRWILSLHPGIIPRFLTCWSTDPNSNLSPVEKPLCIRIQPFLLPLGVIYIKLLVTKAEAAGKYRCVFTLICAYRYKMCVLTENGIQDGTNANNT